MPRSPSRPSPVLGRCLEAWGAVRGPVPPEPGRTPRTTTSPPSDPSPVAPALDSHGRGRAASPTRPADRRRRRSAARAPSHPTKGRASSRRTLCARPPSSDSPW